jgi:hypothetical protein
MYWVEEVSEVSSKVSEVSEVSGVSHHLRRALEEHVCAALVV